MPSGEFRARLDQGGFEISISEYGFISRELTIMPVILNQHLTDPMDRCRF